MKEAVIEQRRLTIGIVLCAIVEGLIGISRITLFFSYPALPPTLSYLGVIALVEGVFSLIAAYGLFRLLSWARWLTIGLNILSIIFQFIQLFLISATLQISMNVSIGNYINFIVLGTIIYDTMGLNAPSFGGG